MALTSPYLFNSTVADIHNGVHDWSSDTLKIMLSNTAPSAANTVPADITQIASGGGYTTDGETLTVTSSTQTGGTYSLVTTSDVVWTGGVGDMAPFRYFVLYNSTAGRLIGWWDRGASLTLYNGDTCTYETGGATIYEAVKAA